MDQACSTLSESCRWRALQASASGRSITGQELSASMRPHDRCCEPCACVSLSLRWILGLRGSIAENFRSRKLPSKSLGSCPAPKSCHHRPFPAKRSGSFWFLIGSDLPEVATGCTGRWAGCGRTVGCGMASASGHRMVGSG